MKRIEYPSLERKTLKGRILWPFEVIYAVVELIGLLCIILYPAYQIGLWLFLVAASGSWTLFIGILSCLLVVALWLAFFTSVQTKLALIFGAWPIAGAMLAPALSKLIS